MAKQMVLMMLIFLFVQVASAQLSSLAKPGCQQSCGNLIIPYPFGIGANCSANQTLELYCNNSLNLPRAFFSFNNMEVLNISLQAGTIRVNNPLTTANCANRTNGQDVKLFGPFTFSDTQNRFTAMGCDNLAVISRQGQPIAGCMSLCNTSNITNTGNNCFGINCCQIRIPPVMRFLNASLRSIDPENDENQCRYAFIVDQNWFGNLTNIYSVQSMEQVPAILDWRPSGSCSSFGVLNPFANSSVCGRNTFCTQQGLCSCSQGYEGNPYLPNGCQDIDECKEGFSRCQQICTNTPGSYNCSCNDGWESSGYEGCYRIADNITKTRSLLLLIATTAGLGMLLVLAGMWRLHNVMKRRKKSKLKEKFFKRNGGLLLQQQVSSSEGNVETTKLFNSKELDKATDHYNVDRILGQGGQGTVYKGMLTDGRIVAVKKSKIENESKIKHFINEVVILSQINHRNIVKLHGCCLETEVPLLVYEFIPNGTLLQYIHDNNEDFPLTWDIRIRVATEVAGALYYLHSAASVPIYHRDIKSTNILLDDKYRAKVADFGTSRSISIDQTHLTTHVQGTFGYLDPEYFQSSQFTDKSDVYSFGVVLVELLTGQKPILAPRPDDEGRSLATLFISAMEENRLFDILDSRVMKEGPKDEIIIFANLANRCLNLNGRKRPTMRQVAAELEGIRNHNGLSTEHQQQYEEVDCALTGLTGPWDITLASFNSSPSNNLAVDVEPLIQK